MNNSETPQTPDDQKPNFSIKKGEQVDLQLWLTIAKKIFPDMEPHTIEELQEKAKPSHPICFIPFLAIDDNNEPIGFRWVKFNPNTHYAYVPYGGIIEKHRNKKIYPDIVNQSELQLKQFGISTVLIECEKPEIFSGQEKNDAENRIRFFQKLGYQFLDPTDIPYLGPEWNLPDEDAKKGLNTDYIFGFKSLDDNSENKKDSVERNTYLEMILQLRSLSTGIEDIEEIINTFSSAKKSVELVQKHPNPIKLLPNQ